MLVGPCGRRGDARRPGRAHRRHRPDKLVLSIGRAMARRHGFNDYPFVVIDYPYAENLTTESLELHRQKAWPQVQAVLLGETT